MMDKFAELFAVEEGQGMVEYGLIVGLIAIIVIAVFVALGPQIMELFEDALDVDQEIAELEASCTARGGEFDMNAAMDALEDEDLSSDWRDYCDNWEDEDEEENGE